MTMEQLSPSPERQNPIEVLDHAREHIDTVDENLAGLLVRRMATARYLMLTRRATGRPVYSGEQHNRSMQRFLELTEDGPLDRNTALALIHPLVSAEVVMTVPRDEVNDLADYLRDDQEGLDIIDELAGRLDDIDTQIADLAGARTMTAVAVGEAKADLGLPIYNGKREAQVIDRFMAWTKDGGVPEEIARNTITLLIRSARRIQGEEADEILQGVDFDQELRELIPVEVAAQ